MLGRVILAGLLGGVLVFGAGYVEHDRLEWGFRHMKRPADPSALSATLKSEFPEPGIYYFPLPPKDMKSLSTAEQEKVKDRLKEEYKTGPSGFVNIAPTGEELVFWKVYVLELATNVIAALLAAGVVAFTRPGLGFITRWAIVVLMGLFTWFSMNASYHIWYRFPWPWVQDELFCELFEWAVAGLAIALIVVPKENTER